MTWRKLIPTSLATAAIAIVGIGIATPQGANSQLACGAYAGQGCHNNCERECSNGSCCEWTHRYYQEQEH